LNHPKADPVKRSTFCQCIEKFKEEGKQIAYVDESGFAHDMPRLHGYSIKGKRCYGKYNWGAKGRTNAIGALIEGVLIAVGLISGTVNANVFNCWIQEILLPNLSQKTIVVMDNASFHKSQETKKLLKDQGHTLIYLPPYSPDLNPIEKKWAHAKHIRKSASRSIDELFKFHL
jgi:transposase